MGKIEMARWRVYSRDVRLYLAATIVAAVAGIVVAFGVCSRELSTSIQSLMQTLLGDRIFGHAAFDMFAIGSLIGVLCLTRLLAATISASGTTLGEVLQRLEGGFSQMPLLGRVPVVNRVRRLVVGAGAALLYTFPVLPSIGPALLFYARRYIQGERMISWQSTNASLYYFFALCG
jgi:hypothetical protein